MTRKELSTAAWERILRDGHASSHIPVAIAAALLFFPGRRKAAKSGLWLYRQTLTAFPEATFQELHQKYQAEAIRIAPNELHIADTQLYKIVYKQSDPFPKHEAFYLGFCALSPTVFTKVDQSKHKERRRMLNSIFSHAGVLKLEGLIRERLEALENKIDRLCGKQSIDLYDACRLWTTNIILEFCFADSGGMMEEQSDGFKSKFLKAFAASAKGVSTMQHYPWMRFLSMKTRVGLARFFNEDIGYLMDLIEFARTCVKRWRQVREKGTTLKHPLTIWNPWMMMPW
ncbi:uncharacterized protein FTOL_05432 [Fusarium torulosum]|uniref:Cytochrome P450 monooxygenase n=1 Tax=Fusarium torulosum TaxID=33205 RepID=A0AAE8M7B1_9HYPO|nr:uncharacterized protein FTOL_05432 [Fusarium torulosum]